MSEVKPILGNTTSINMRKPNLMQTDPKKGDYVHGKEEFLQQVNPDANPKGSVINVKLYGATGDGVTDDTSAIASAIAAMDAGDTLYFPEGVYRVRNIELKSDMIVQGAGWCSVIQLLDATTDYQGNNNCLNIEGTKNNPIRNIIIRDIKLDGTRSTQRSGGDSQDGRLDGIKIRHASDILVENVWMYNNGYHGCIMTFASNVVFERCKATDNGFRPIHGHTQIRNCRVANCVCENNGLGVSGGSGFENDSIYFFGAEDLVICNNIVKSNRRGCITVGCEQDHSAENIIPTRNITISGNVCECYEDLAYVPTAESDTGVAKFSSQGIVVYGGNHVLDNVSVVGNTIRNAHEAIRLYAQENELCSLNAVISGNTILDCSYGVSADDVADVVVSDNQAKSLAIAWMSARNAANWQIHGNNVNAPDASEHLCQISRSNNVVIRDNNMIGNGVAVYAPSPNSGIVVVNNTLYGFSGMVPVLNPDGATAGNILDATLDEDTANTATQKVCVDPYPNAGFVRPTLANPNTGSTSWSYTTPVPITPDDISYEINTYVSVPVGTAPGDYNYPSVYTGIVFLAGTELTDAVGIATITNGQGAVEFSDFCNPGTNNNTWGVRISLTAQAVKELFPTATHVMMQVEAWHSDPESLSNAYHTLNDGHAYVYREAAVDLSGYVRTVNGNAPDANGNVEITIPDGSGNVNYSPVEKTEGMTQPVGVDENGLLWTAPTEGSSGSGTPTVRETVVGTTPLEVTTDGLYIRPDVDTRVYNISDGSDGVENLMEQFQTVKTYADQIVYGETGKTAIEAQSKVDGENPAIIADIYGYSAEPGDYTLLVESTTNTFIRVKKRTNSSSLTQAPGTNLAQGYTNAVVNFTITEDDVATYPCNIGIQITTTSAVLPDTYTIKLVKGKYDAMPEGVSLEFQVAAGQKFSLNPFKGIMANSEPVTNVYESVITESGSTGAGATETSSGTLLCFGDSLTATRYSMYPEMLTEMGMNAINFGVSGMHLRAVNSPYCMCSIVDALKAGDMSAQIQGGENANYSSLLSLMPTATGLVIWYGTNDYNGDCAFEGDTTDTIEGALRYVLTELFTLYPKKAIFVVSPFMYTYAYGSQPVNPNGSVADMIEVMRNVCKEFAVPFIDMSRESGFNQITRMTLTSDQLHPDTTAGRERLARFLYGKLRSYGQV